MREKGGDIRNRNAYLFGVVKRYRTLVDGGPDASQGRSLSNPVLVSRLLSISLPLSLYVVCDIRVSNFVFSFPRLV